MQGVDPTTVIGRYIDECWNRGRLDLIRELVADDFVDHFPFDPDLPEGRDGLTATIRLLRQAFGDLRLSIDDMVAEEDRVVVRFTLNGHQIGTFAGQPALDRAVAIPGLVIFRVQDHQIIDQWCLFDAFGLLRQLGATDLKLAGRSEARAAQPV